jgi:16S rRNA (guanine527-N7)-methyltransferase
MDILLKYFPNLSPIQIKQFEQLGPLYSEWNQKINVVSRKDIENIYDHHILHSLAIAKIVNFKPEAKVLDLGTGGGLPGIPLAILFPEVNFVLADGTGKKIKVVQAIAGELGLKNVQALHSRAEELKMKFDFVICRAVARLEKLVGWSQKLISEKQMHALPNGLITLKGGAIKAEIKELPKGEYVEVYPLTDFFKEPYYEEKVAVYVQW